MKPVISPRLLAPFESRSTEREGAFQLDQDLATIAYLLDQEKMFSLFTRRLVMDHCAHMETCVRDLFAIIPILAMGTKILPCSDASHANFGAAQLERQRVEAKEMIDNLLRATATHYCQTCRSSKFDPSLHVAVGQKLDPEVSAWPPRYATDYTIRQVLAAITSLDDFCAFEGNAHEICVEHTNTLESAERVHNRCKVAVSIADFQLPGLCFTCVKEHRMQDVYCEHHEPSPLDRLRELDPIS
jgi:hypothetical protein